MLTGPGVSCACCHGQQGKRDLSVGVTESAQAPHVSVGPGRGMLALRIPLSGQRQCWAGLEIPRPLALPLFFRILHDPHTSHHHRASYVHCQMVHNQSITRGGLWHPHVPARFFWENGSKPSWFGDLRLWWLQCWFPALETALADFWSVVYLWEEGSGNFFRGLGVTQRFLGLRQG